MLIERWRLFGFKRRTWAGATLRRGAVCALVLLAGCKGAVDLHTGLSDEDANEVVAALMNDGIDAQKHAGKDGIAVSIPEESLARATAVLEGEGLPHRKSARMGDVFKKEGLISSPLEERARYMSALSQELESTLGQIDGVVVARVHVVLSEKASPGEPVQPPSAAVFIKHRPTLEPDAMGYRIRQLVARSIPGMGVQAVDRVSVVFVEATPLPEALAQPSNLPLIVAFTGAIFVALLVALALVAYRFRWFKGLRRATPASLPAPASTATVSK
jgi:type III secretion protein J